MSEVKRDFVYIYVRVHWIPGRYLHVIAHFTRMVKPNSCTNSLYICYFSKSQHLWVENFRQPPVVHRIRAQTNAISRFAAINYRVKIWSKLLSAVLAVHLYCIHLYEHDTTDFNRCAPLKPSCLTKHRAASSSTFNLNHIQNDIISTAYTQTHVLYACELLIWLSGSHICGFGRNVAPGVRCRATCKRCT